MTELECRIFNFIECQYKAKFLGSVKVTKDAECTYTLDIVTDNWMFPISIIKQCTCDEDFYNFATKQIAERNLVRVGYFKLKLDVTAEEEQ